MRPITARQQAILEFVGGYLREQGFPPTFREIGRALGLANVGAVRGHLAALEKKGYITKAPDKARSIRIVQGPSILSRFKRRLHEFARTDEGVLHEIVYGLAMATRGRRPLLAGPIQRVIEQALDREATEHGWTFVRRQVQSDHVLVIVRAWPNHSPGQVVARIRQACEAVLKRRPLQTSDKRLWARGYVATTNLTQIDEMVGVFLKEAASEI